MNTRNPSPAKYGESLTLKNPAYSYFPQELIELHQEIHKHPTLLQLLHDQEDKDVYIQLAEIATYCRVLVDGDYTYEDMLGLCTLLTRKLQSARTLLILPSTK